MEKDNEQLEALQDIRKMMKESSKFLSLSGLSGIIAGIYALAGAYIVHSMVNEWNRDYLPSGDQYDLTFRIGMVGAAVLILSIATAYILSARKAKKIHQRLFDHTSKKVFWSMVIPLTAGGVFCFALFYHGLFLMISPSMLLFYGLALLNSSKYTLSEIKYLALLQISLGLVASFLPAHGLLFWALGFGVLHIIYGAIVWNKYDRNIS